MPRLLLADDHADTAELLSGLLRPEFDVIAQVQDGRDLVAAVERLSPDVIVSDISMPGLDGIEAATAILDSNRAARIVLVSVHCDPILAQRGFEVGVLGYVPKSAAGDELVPAVHSALRGEHHVSPLVTARRSTRTP
jgi:DNA-binding NarL/FixJ family response regulator